MILFFFGILSFSSFISITIISSIMHRFSEYKSANNLVVLDFLSIFNSSTSFLSVSTLCIAFIFLLVISVSSISSSCSELLDLPWNLFLLILKLRFLSNLFNLSIFSIPNSFSSYFVVSFICSISSFLIISFF